jgi:uncharacterized protein CbrC (UPF0167 family)
MNEALPVFRYHPDPVVSGSIEEATVVCVACGKPRTHIYVGPVYAKRDPSGQFCPWCVSDGTAASKFDAEFTDVGWGVPTEVSESIRDEVAHRTPGFHAWQQDHWLYHCGDACAFLGRIGRQELGELPDALDMLMHESDAFGWSERESREYVDGLNADGEATAYLFRCLVYGTQLAFSDSA